MTRFARHTVLVVALLLSGCETIPPAVGDTMADAQSAAPVSTVSEADVRIPGFIRAMLERAPGAEYWLCRDESDWKHPERVHLAAVRLGRVSPDVLVELKGSELSDGEVFLSLLALVSDMGAIAVAGETHIASFGVRGVNRRWDWTPHAGGGYQDTLVLQPSGDASYIDFRLADDTNAEGGRRATASVLFQCEPGR